MSSEIETLPEPSRVPALPAPRLPAEFWHRRPLTRVAAALDGAVLRTAKSLVDRAIMPAPEELPGFVAAAEMLVESDLQREPARFFAFGEEGAVPASVNSRRRRSIRGGAVVAHQLETRYRPFDFELGREDLDEKSQVGWLLLDRWRHESASRPRATVVAIHGFAMGRPRLDAFSLFARDWFERGLDVAVVTLPYHGIRRPREARFSGEHFAVPNLLRLSEAVREAVFELRLAVSWLRGESGGAPVGLLGLSLGGYLTSLMAGLYDDLDFAVPMVPPVCMGDLAWRFIVDSRHYRDGGLPSLSEEKLRAAFRLHSPLAHPLKLPRERALIVAGRGDRVVPPEHASALWRHWGRPDIHWFSGSHVAPFGRRRVMRRVARHLGGLGIL